MDGLDAILNRRTPTAWEEFWASPVLYVARKTYEWSTRPPALPTEAPDSSIRVVCISDTHNTHLSQPPLPEGDILIHAGDLTQAGSATEIGDALAWLSSQPHPHKVIVAGNHDVRFAEKEVRTRLLQANPTILYLEDSAATLTVRGRTLRLYGSPRTPKYGSWAFQYLRSDSAAIWADVPAFTDILITHGPPLGHLDLGGGCEGLLAAVWRVRPRLHVFGHMHGGRGVARVTWSRAQRAYEDVCKGRRPWAGLVRLIFWAIVDKFKPVGDVETTILVNAAAVGGRRDDKKMGPTVVRI
ncbi:metallophosphoesterase domain-protein 1 [Favolaschia claudopus]|uniref:Metallophosphoesterase domain-protein 1 n=1 Tax=Favolaschia claudopus TaxID=2862362 RepID=A0AAW0EH99_9AGAR